MKKKQIKSKPKNPAANTANAGANAPKAKAVNRRAFMEKTLYSAGGLTILGGLGYWGASAMMRTIHESDLTRIGKGKPAVVQIHDPQCTLCLALQKQTRSVLSAHDEEKYDFLVANIKSQSGRELANRYGVSHVTLLLFDGKGNMVRVLQGPTTEAVVKNTVDAFLSKYS